MRCSCRAPSWFQDNKGHCGSCGNSCASQYLDGEYYGERCIADACATLTPAGDTQTCTQRCAAIGQQCVESLVSGNCSYASSGISYSGTEKMACSLLKADIAGESFYDYTSSGQVLGYCVGSYSKPLHCWCS